MQAKPLHEHGLTYRVLLYLEGKQIKFCKNKFEAFEYVGKPRRAPVNWIIKDNGQWYYLNDYVKQKFGTTVYGIYPHLRWWQARYGNEFVIDLEKYGYSHGGDRRSVKIKCYDKNGNLIIQFPGVKKLLLLCPMKGGLTMDLLKALKERYCPLIHKVQLIPYDGEIKEVILD